MNHKILHKLEQMIHTSPQLLRNQRTLQQAIQGTFDIEIDNVEYTHIGELVDRIEEQNSLILDFAQRHSVKWLQHHKHSDIFIGTYKP